MSSWHAFPKQPTHTGLYIVAHRGHQVITHYRNPKEKDQYVEGSKFGWIFPEQIDFGPTHWRKFEPINVPEDPTYDRFSTRLPKKQPYIKKLNFLERMKNKFFCEHYFNEVSRSRFSWNHLFGQKVLHTIITHKCNHCGKCKNTEEQEIIA